MADSSNAGEAVDKGELGGGDKLFPQGLRTRIFLLLGMATFTTAAVFQSYLQSTLFDGYNTQMSVLQSFDLIRSKMHDTTANEIDQFWVWLAYLSIELGEKETDTGFMKLAGSPDYFVSDILITTRRAKEEVNEIFGDMKNWVSTEQDPFSHQFDEAFFDTTPFAIDSKGTLVEHQTQGSFGNRGGFAFTIPVNGKEQETLDQIKFLQNPANEFMASSTMSVVASVIFYNKVTYSFVYVALKVQRSPGGLLRYHFEFNRPIGQILDENTHGMLGTIEWLQIFLVGAYFAYEAFVLVTILIRYLAEKKNKSDYIGRKQNFEDYIKSVLALYPPSGEVVARDDNDQEAAANDDEKKLKLIMFYWDEKEKKKLYEIGPSLGNALGIMLRRDQRVVMYLVCFLLIPINLFHQDWHAVYDERLKMKEQTLTSILSRDSEWRVEHTQQEILNDFYQLNLDEDNQLICMTIFLFFVISRLLSLMATFSQRLSFNLALLTKIYDFLTSFMITLAFVLLAWVMCQYLLFGSKMLAYSTLQMALFSTIMIALRDFVFLDLMFEQEPNITLVFFICFVISVMLFLGAIFVSLVMTIYSEIAISSGIKAKPRTEDILKEEHWSFLVLRGCASTKKRCAQNACCLLCARCCCKKKESKEKHSIEDMIEKTGGRQQPKNFKQIQKKVGFKDEDEEINSDDESDSNSSASESGSQQPSQDSEGEVDPEDVDVDVDKKQEDSEEEEDQDTPDGDSATAKKKKKKKDKKKKRKEKKSREREDKEAAKAKSKQEEEEALGYPRRAPKLVFENVDAEEIQATMLTEMEEREKRIVPQRRTRMTEAIEDSDSDEELQYSDSDISMQSDFDNVDDMQLVKSKAQRKRGERSAEGGDYVRSPEEQRQLMQLRWVKDFEVYDLNADLQQDLRHTSNKQDAFMIKQREQRCGKVIWKTLVQLLYMGLYLYVIFTRNNITAMQQHNKDMEQIVTKTRYHDEDKVIVMEEIDFSSFEKLIDFLRLMDTNLLQPKNTTITNDLDQSALRVAELYYLMSGKNYIVLQGQTYCLNVQTSSKLADGTIQVQQLQFAPGYAQDLKSKFDPEAFNGSGALCFAVFLQDEGNPTDVLVEAIKEINSQAQQNDESLSVDQMSFTLLVGEPVLNMLTRVEFHWEKMSSGHINFNVSMTSRQYQIDVFGIMLQIVFIGFFVLNLYLFLTTEHDIYQRLKKWRQHNIEPLSKVERDQREKQQPQIFRTLSVLFRPANIAYFAHLCLTIYSELLYTYSFIKLTGIVATLADVPGQPILDNLFDEDDVKITSREARQKFQYDIVQLFNEYLEAALVYRRMAIFNLFLICAQPLTSASQSARFRAFLLALGQTAKASLELYMILFFFSFSVLFYGLHSFGYISLDFKEFTYASMTIFKMMVGRLVGTYYQVTLAISAVKAMFFTLPVILMKALFLTVFLAIVSYQYEDEVLNKDFSSNINILRSIFFCNISLEKRQKNKRTKQLQESEAMKEMGKQGVDDANDEADEEDNADGQLGGVIAQDGAKVVNGGLEIYNKLDIKFVIQRKIPEWAMACADDIRQEVSNRKNLRQESIQLAQKLFLRSENNLGLTAKSKEKQLETNQLNSFNLMVARKDYITYVWFGIQFFFMQGQLIQKVIESLENEIKTMLVPYMVGQQREEYLKMLTRIELKPAESEQYNKIELKNPITNRKEVVTRQHLLRDTLHEELYIQAEVKEYILELIELVEARLQRIRKQWRTMMLQSKQKKILQAISKKENLFKYN